MIDIQGLKLAIDTGNPEFYNGRLEDALSELVEEAEAARLALVEAGDFDNVAQLAKEYNKLWNDKDDEEYREIEKIDGCLCIKEDEDYTYSIINNGGNNLKIVSTSAKLKEGGEYEIIVRELR